MREGASGTLAAKDNDVIPLGALGVGMRDLAISLKEACAMSQTFEWDGAERGGMYGCSGTKKGRAGKLLRDNSNKMHAMRPRGSSVDACGGSGGGGGSGKHAHQDWPLARVN